MLNENPPNRSQLRDHYATIAIVYEMAKWCAYREIVALSDDGGLRPMKMYRAKDVEFWLNRIRPWDRPTDLYGSVFRVNLPMLPADVPGMRKMHEVIKRDWPQMVTGYSWFLDVDVYYPPQPEGAAAAATQQWRDEVRARFFEGRDACMRGVEVSRDMGLATYPFFSGTGWNVRMEDFPFKGRPDDAPQAMKALAAEVCRVAGLPFLNPKKEKTAARPIVVDNSVYDVRRINRVPFTVSRKSGLVATPLTLGELRQCEPDWFMVDDYARRFAVRDRLQHIQDDAAAAVAAVA